ncbi:MAG TPA: hypothetical protein VGK59_04060 [Ohtaekwangia sp.]
MIPRILLFGVIATFSGASISCSEDIPDCPSRMCIVAGGWRLVEVFVDNEVYTGDLSQYRLTLNIPRQPPPPHQTLIVFLPAVLR